MFVKTKIWTVGRTEHGMAAFLRLPNSSRCVPISVETEEAQTILSGLTGALGKPPKPLDLLVSLGSLLYVRLEAVEIFTGLGSSLYRARLNYSGASTKFSLEARPPDALALAVRCNTDVFLEQSITQNDAIRVSLMESETALSTQLLGLRDVLETYLADENYEQATQIRDQIKKLETRGRTEEK